MTIRPELPNLEDLSAAELRSLVVSLLETVAQLEAKVAALTEENSPAERAEGPTEPEAERDGEGHRSLAGHRPAGPVARSDAGSLDRPRAPG